MTRSGIRRFYILLPIFIACYIAVVIALADFMKNKPYVDKLGFIPSVTTLEILSADHKEFLGASLMLKVQIYFGGLIDMSDNKLQIPADYPAMSRTIDAALQLDPYNMDGYYFAQAILAWDVGKADLANTFLERGMNYRTWDWQLPYFAGFNYAFFLNDYKNAAIYYRRAAELSGNEMLVNLAGRYMQRSGNTEMAIGYLGMMAKKTRHDALKKSLLTRRAAFIEVLKIEKAVDSFFQVNGKLPGSMEILIQSGFLSHIPDDPYGGKFFLQDDGSVSSTSGFAFAVPKN